MSLLIPTFRRYMQPATSSSRYLSTSFPSFNTPSQKVPISLIAELRKRNPVSLSKAKEALSASSHSIEAALEWLEKDLEISGAKKAEKVGGRVAKEGLIGVTVMGTRAAMVELRCETDFVARNSTFRHLVQNITSTAAFLDLPDSSPSPNSVAIDPVVSFPVEELNDAPLVPVDPISMTSETSSPSAQTVSQAIRSAITQTGENIQLQRAISFSSPIDASSTLGSIPLRRKDNGRPFLLPGVYVHSSTGGANEGQVGGLAVLSILSTNGTPILVRISSETSLGGELQKMARTAARQVVGFPTTAVSRPAAVTGTSVEGGVAEGEVPEYLMEQPFMMYQGSEKTVKEVLEVWGEERGLKVGVEAMRRWTVGDEA